MPQSELFHYLLDILVKKRRIFLMARELTLDGGEITILKRIGLSGGQTFGRLLTNDLEEEEIPIFLETLLGLIDQGYVLSNKVNIQVIEEVERAFFRVNPAFALALRDAINPARRRERERVTRAATATTAATLKTVAGFSKPLRLWPWLAAISTGFIYAACFPPFDQGWLCWIALTPLLAAIWFSDPPTRNAVGLRDLSLGYVAGLAFFWTVFFWLRTVTIPGLILVGALHGHLLCALELDLRFAAPFVATTETNEPLDSTNIGATNRFFCRNLNLRHGKRTRRAIHL